jgi:hypothetical protein
MAVWRMAFRVGDRGYDMWPECQRLGVAAYRADPFRDVDLRRYSSGEPSELWRQLKTNAKSSLKYLAYTVQKWDTIYVKQGTRIVGRGVVSRSYRFDHARLLVDNEGFPWCHQVKVDWELGFQPIDIKLGAEPIAVWPLSGDSLQRLQQALSANTNFIQTRVQSDIESLKNEEEWFEEGGKESRLTNHYERDPKLRASAVRYHGTRCSVCGFDFAEVYGEHGLGFIEVHHLRLRSTLARKTKVDPKRDMATVCSNCHRMIHRTRERVLTAEELKKMMANPDG